MNPIEQTQLLTLDEFVRLYEKEGAFELIDGERRPIMPPVAIHGLMIRALFRLLDAWCRQHNLGEVVAEMPYVLLQHSGWVKGSLVPDVMFFVAERWDQYTSETEDWIKKPFILIPDLAIEVVSQNDSYVEIQDKVNRYLRDGVRLIWVVDPFSRQVSVYDGERYLTLGDKAILTGGEVIPDLAINLADLFQLTT
jgi:Uma2 family endonuclease